MTIFPNALPSALLSADSLPRTATAGLKTPADSQPAPWGERIGVSDARRHALKGKCCADAAKLVAAAAKLKDAVANNAAKNILCF
jgi:hypothetical protein